MHFVTTTLGVKIVTQMVFTMKTFSNFVSLGVVLDGMLMFIATFSDKRKRSILPYYYTFLKK